MSFSKIASIVLYVVVGITLPILILFYFGESLVNKEQFQSKIQKIENPVEQSSTANYMVDLQSADTLGTQADSAATAVAEPVSTPEVAEVVTFTFIENMVYHKTDVAIFWGYLLLLIAAVSTIIFPIAYAIKHPANMVRSLLILLGVAVLIGISYILSSGETIEIIGYTGTDNSNPAALKLIDTGLIFMYFILGLALFSILYAEIAKYFK